MTWRTGDKKTPSPQRLRWEPFEDQDDSTGFDDDSFPSEESFEASLMQEDEASSLYEANSGEEEEAEADTEEEEYRYGKKLSDNNEKCWEKAVALLSRQDYASARLERKLRESFTEAAVAFAMGKADEYGYLNDHAYAERFIQSRRRTKSRREIRSALWERGIKLSEAELEEFYPRDDEEEAILAWLKRHRRDRDRCEGDGYKLRTLQHKFVQSLLRKGFSYGNIAPLLQDFLLGEDDE